MKQYEFDRSRVCMALLTMIMDGGMQETVRKLGAVLQKASPLDAYGTMRLEDLCQAAGEFDRGQSRDVNAFIRFMDFYHLNAAPTDGVVRVMTVHQAKGLGFDVVICPDLQGRSMGSTGVIDVLIGDDPDTNQPEWLLQAPRKGVALYDPVLASEVRRVEHDSTFSELCVLYVALTRARRAMYIVSSFQGKTSKAITSAALIKQQLCGQANPVPDEIAEGYADRCIIYETGNARWFESIDTDTLLPQRSEKDVSIPVRRDVASKRKRRISLTPSSQERVTIHPSELFQRTTLETKTIGTAVHELFERLSWLDKDEVGGIVTAWKEHSACDLSVQSAAISLFLSICKDPVLSKRFKRPEGAVQLWREKSFEVLLDDKWITGIFDRVVIYLNNQQVPVKAEIIDYKTDQTDEKTLIAVYRPQLTLYMNVLSRLLKLSKDRITAYILAVDGKQLIPLSNI